MDEVLQTQPTDAPVADTPEEAPAEASNAQAARVAQLLAAQRTLGAPTPSSAAPAPAAAKPRGPGRPKKDPNAAPTPPGDKKKKKSGRHATRAELKAEVDRLRATSGQPVAPGTSPALSGPISPREPSALHKPEVRARFVAGVVKGAQAGGRFMAARRGKHYEVGKLEAEALGESTADALLCLEDVAPTWAPVIQVVVSLAPLGIFAMVLLGIVSERLEIDAAIEHGKRARVMPEGTAVTVVPAPLAVVHS